MEPFVGTSVPMSRFEMDITSYRTSEIYSLTIPPSTKTSGCLLKQYYKKDAKRLWSFPSLRFYNDGLYPINPLRARDHPIVSEDSLLECASFLLRTFVYLEIDRSKIGDLLVKVKSDKKLKRKLKLSADGFNTFSELKSLINKKEAILSSSTRCQNLKKRKKLISSNTIEKQGEN
ncbi:hypothetical protein RMCBS344292_01626 [Rhizopus microsporus]|nr:hypothetical protein RMCBS344292_01626 [Rhizopus microsporus]